MDDSGLPRKQATVTVEPDGDGRRAIVTVDGRQEYVETFDRTEYLASDETLSKVALHNWRLALDEGAGLRRKI